MTLNMIGAYGEWAARSMQDPARLSFRQPMFGNVEAWRAVARARFREILLGPGGAATPRRRVVQHQLEFDGLSIEHLQWQLPYGPPTEALVLKPAGAKGKLPGIVGLHDHGGNKYFGLRKITRMSKDPHPVMLRHQEQYYGGVAWANELARRGYVVLVHDTFTFGSRRMRLADLPANIRNNLVEVNPEAEDEIQRYNQFAGDHEHLIAKSLFSAGMTWPGVFVFDDQTSRGLPGLAAGRGCDPDRLRRAIGRRTAYRDADRGRRADPLFVLRGDDDDVARLSAEQVLHAHVDVLCAGTAAGSGLSRGAGTRCAESGAGVEQPPGCAVHDAGDGAGGPDTHRGVQEGRRPGALPGELLRRAAQVRPGDAEGSLCLV